MKTVYLGMSGGVDSSVSAVLLKEAGYRVVGVYMKNWSRDLPGMKCPWADDLSDAKRVATKLGIDFEVFDFEKEYKQKVVDYMLDEFKKGNTPNPDVMCNEEIKFKLFYDIAMSKGADMIATGHYAQITDGELARAVDENKDQTYFLYRISQDAIEHTIFPIGHMLKPDVKKFAEEHGLANAYKKESMGVCFVGEVGMKDFLKTYLEESGEAGIYIRPGEIKDADTGEVLGMHDGAIFVTLGQRHGLDVGGGLPYYVTGKDMAKNEVYVSKDLNSKDLWTNEIKIRDGFFRLGPIDTDTLNGMPVQVRLRHRAPLIPARIELTCWKHGRLTHLKEVHATLKFDKPIKRPAPGQSAVIYDDEICLGGGIVV
ncbi:MAG: tRNA 2-thiouridine(34) synthase MnmA [Candidatus Saccharibacteria bacterium]|nr:tRNA 2-thiouridine(34) synthase MnmA [Candidatus Saccharibacteria bacterium]